MAKEKSDKKDKKRKETIEESIALGEDVEMEGAEVAKVSIGNLC